MNLAELGRSLTPAARMSWEQRLTELVGERVAAVRYVELNYRDPDRYPPGKDPNDGPTWDGPDFHSLDYGLEYDFESGRQWWCSWQQPGDEGESLLFGEGTALTNELTRARVWDVSDQAPWASLRGSAILQARIAWDHWPTGWMPGAPQIWCQDAYALTFEAGDEILIALGDRSFTTGRLAPSADNLVVFWSHHHALQAGLRCVASGAL